MQENITNTIITSKCCRGPKYKISNFKFKFPTTIEQVFFFGTFFSHVFFSLSQRIYVNKQGGRICYYVPFPSVCKSCVDVSINSDKCQQVFCAG
jgi:hypothetical protein